MSKDLVKRTIKVTAGGTVGLVVGTVSGAQYAVNEKLQDTLIDKIVMDQYIDDIDYWKLPKVSKKLNKPETQQEERFDHEAVNDMEPQNSTCIDSPFIIR